MVLYGAELSVSNNATIGGDQTVDGDLTVGGDLNVAGEIQSGNLLVNGESTLSGKTSLADLLSMNGNDLVLGGQDEHEAKIRYAADPDRIEFLIGDKVRFVIDEKGGHNA